MVVVKYFLIWIFVFLFIGCSIREEDRKITNKAECIKLLKTKIIKIKNGKKLYIFGLFENISEDTIYLFKGMDQTNCQIDSFLFSGGDYSYEFMHSYVSPQKFDLFVFKPEERNWFYLGNTFGDYIDDMISAKVTLFWAKYSDTSWDIHNSFIKSSSFRAKFNDVLNVNLHPDIKGFEDIKPQKRND